MTASGMCLQTEKELVAWVKSRGPKPGMCSLRGSSLGLAANLGIGH